jgi:electron transfer flavoprotein alpha subunit
MGEIFVLVEHRDDAIRDITYEILHKADALSKALSHTVTAVVIGGERLPFLDDVAQRADEVLIFEDERLSHFSADLYKFILAGLIEERSPFLTLMAHSPWGMNLAPALAVKTRLPLATDAVDILVDQNRPVVIRQIYSGKIFSKVRFQEARGCLITVRSGVFPPDRAGEREGRLIRREIPAELPESRRQFVEFMDTAAGEVDIAQAQLLVSVGRGIGGEENVPLLMELAEQMGGVLSCSRPVVDKNWLPKFRQVGTSGKSVKPKVYLAFGISGAFQHVAGISGAGTVIAVNKDRKAPIFRVADYGVVDDLFNVVSALKEKLGN